MIKEKLFYLGNKALIRNDKQELLLLRIRRNKEEDYYDLPGGRVDKNEDAVSALIREVEEETGITNLTVIKHLGMALTPIQIPISQEEKGGLILSIYTCFAEDFSSLIAEEGMELGWYSVPQLLEKLKQYPKDLLELIEAELAPPTA